MKKMIAISMMLVMSIVGLVFGYKSLKMEDVIEDIKLEVPFLSDDQPVTATVKTIAKPFKDENVKTLVDFYDSSKDNQEKSIIVIDKTYIQNKGVLYKSDKTFDVLSIYDGIVIDVGKDDLTGNYIVINHDNDLVATYKILNSVSLKKGDQVKKNDKLGTGGNSQIAQGYLLLLELKNKNMFVNPENYYNKSIKEI